MTELAHDISLAPYTQYHIGGVAREVHFPTDCGELAASLAEIRSAGTHYFILGGGSNVLVGDAYWDGAVIVTSRMTGIETSAAAIMCGAGLPSSRVAEVARDHGMTGLEFLYLLPGSIGGAVAGNARYDNIDVSTVLIRLTAVHPEHGARTFEAGEIAFAYKSTSITAGGWLICEVELAWHSGDPVAISARMAAIEQARDDSRHFEYPSCGCIFKNDHDRNIQVGRLIDSLDLKGLRIGDAEVAPFHANFIINRGHATAGEVLALIETLERTIREQTGIILEREVRLLGAFDPLPDDSHGSPVDSTPE